MGKLKKSLSGLGDEIVGSVRDSIQSHESMVVQQMERDCICKTIQAMQEVDISEEKIVQLLQKYWDLRLSEAKYLLNLVNNSTQQGE